MGRQETTDPSLPLAMPGFHQVGAALQPGAGPGIVELVHPGAGLGLVHVIDVLRQDQPKAGRSQIGGIAGHVGRYLQQAGGAASDGFQGAQQGQRPAFLTTEQRAGRNRKCQPGRKAEIFQNPPVPRCQQVRVAVDQARKNRLASSVHHVGVGVCLCHFPGRSYGYDPVFGDCDGGGVQNRAEWVAGHYRCVGDNRGHVHPPDLAFSGSTTCPPRSDTPRPDGTEYYHLPAGGRPLSAVPQAPCEAHATGSRSWPGRHRAVHNDRSYRPAKRYTDVTFSQNRRNTRQP